ncbi:unnamed protein product [Echinostoma caproni]|uniref:CUB domain-containing protein n=1 Tax=Echinostoma caproni TaxID=27848 RepID=A0A183AIZ3_9TREM|nr:unnamed protein product [Echinostoma caproni]
MSFKDCAVENVTVFDQDTERKIAVLCGMESESSVLSTGSRMRVTFHTIRSPLAGPFAASYEPYICGGVLSTPNGAFWSPLYPDRYPLNSNCRWTIMLPVPGIELTFRAFDVGLPSCTFEKVVIFEGVDESAPLKDILCGTLNGRSYHTTGSSLLIVFQANQWPRRATGFYATYKSTALPDNQLTEAHRAKIPIDRVTNLHGLEHENSPEGLQNQGPAEDQAKINDLEYDNTFDNQKNILESKEPSYFDVGVNTKTVQTAEYEETKLNSNHETFGNVSTSPDLPLGTTASMVDILSTDNPSSTKAMKTSEDDSPMNETSVPETDNIFERIPEGTYTTATSIEPSQTSLLPLDAHQESELPFKRLSESATDPGLSDDTVHQSGKESGYMSAIPVDTLATSDSTIVQIQKEPNHETSKSSDAETETRDELNLNKGTLGEQTNTVLGLISEKSLIHFSIF